jgi:hypothetical protein
MNIMRKSKLSNYKKFLENTMSGAGAPGSGSPFFGKVGPNYGEEKSPSTGLSLKTITYDGKIWMYEDYQQLLNDFTNSENYEEYIKGGGRPLNDFNLENIIKILTFKKD